MCNEFKSKKTLRLLKPVQLAQKLIKMVMAMLRMRGQEYISSPCQYIINSKLGYLHILQQVIFIGSNKQEKWNTDIDL